MTQAAAQEQAPERTASRDSAADQNGVYRFEVMISGRYRAFAFDVDVETFSGTESLLVDRYGGSVQEWIGRLENKRPTGADIVLIAYLSARREQVERDGASALEWDAFADTVAPYTLRVVREGTAPNRPDQRRAARSGSPTTRAAATKS